MDELRRSAKRAYERGRLSRALASATLSLMVVGLALVLNMPSTVTLALGAVSVGVHVVAAYAHDHTRVGLWLALGLGAGQLLATGFMKFFGMQLFPEICESICFVLVCMASAAVGFFAARPLALASQIARKRSVIAGVALGAPLMALGCLPGALGMLSGSVIGLTIGLVPGWLLVQRAKAY